MIVAFSSYEAEYITLNKAGKKAILLQKILKELGFIDYSPFPILIYKDNQENIVFAKNPEFHCRTKHINIQYHWIQDVIS